MRNRFLKADELLRLAREIWQPPSGPPARIEVFDEPGYDIKQDLAWQMRLRVVYLGRDLTCYLNTLDLARSPEKLGAHLIDGWRAAFWNDAFWDGSSEKRAHG